MKKTSAIITTFLLIFMVSACNLPKAGGQSGAPSESVATIVESTLVALTQGAQQTPSSSPKPVNPTDTFPPTMTLTVTLTSVPSMTPSITKTPVPTTTPIPKPGTIEGGISGYPYGAVPSLSIVAFGQEPPYNYSYWITAPGDTSYTMTSNYLIPGKYQVVAYDSSNRVGGCTTLVTVKSEETSNCDITDWGGSYPSKPAGVP